MFTEQRREDILKNISKEKSVNVADLAKNYKVSKATIRNDLSFLEDLNKVKRTYGGAILNQKIGDFKTISEKRIINTQKKEIIAKKALSLIEEEDTIALDSGSTSFTLCKYLTKFKNLNLIVNDFDIAKYLSKNTDFKLIFVGGLIGRSINSTNGPLSLNFLSSINCDKVFIGCESFDLDKGFSTFDENQAAFKKKLMETSKTKIVLIDSSKFNKRSAFSFAKVSDFDFFVTDKMDKEYEKEINKDVNII